MTPRPTIFIMGMKRVLRGPCLLFFLGKELLPEGEHRRIGGLEHRAPLRRVGFVNVAVVGVQARHAQHEASAELPAPGAPESVASADG